MCYITCVCVDQTLWHQFRNILNMLWPLIRVRGHSTLFPLSYKSEDDGSKAVCLFVQKLPSRLLTCVWLFCSCVTLEWLNNPAKARNTFLCSFIQWPCPFLWAVTHFNCSLCFVSVLKCHMWWWWCSLFLTWFAFMPRCWRADRCTSDAGFVEESESDSLTMRKKWPPLSFF